MQDLVLVSLKAVDGRPLRVVVPFDFVDAALIEVPAHRRGPRQTFGMQKRINCHVRCTGREPGNEEFRPTVKFRLHFLHDRENRCEVGGIFAHRVDVRRDDDERQGLAAQLDELIEVGLMITSGPGQRDQDRPRRVGPPALGQSEVVLHLDRFRRPQFRLGNHRLGRRAVVDDERKTNQRDE
ncbi:MAG: hypothetical protein QM811_22520 [Pirellulales bacterium]